jgi:hypothetical protein
MDRSDELTLSDDHFAYVWLMVAMSTPYELVRVRARLQAFCGNEIEFQFFRLLFDESSYVAVDSWLLFRRANY